ncbi:metalloregulator ArsR/SmtB family transcription factor [Kitasatospora sp. NBC_01560]|uniref:ArsR/SmtB family transcription factor n=1 Tax=Kitasatospora sp. NBC_01560 TaxID=2975965 RepID=UPI00386FCFE8
MGTQIVSWDSADAERAVAVLKAVADASRYRLLWALTRRELPVSALAELLGAHVAATSQHLARLRAAGLVESRREGTRIYYRAAEHVSGLLEETQLVARATAERATGEAAVPSGAAAAREQPARAARRVHAARPVTGHG